MKLLCHVAFLVSSGRPLFTVSFKITKAVRIAHALSFLETLSLRYGLIIAMQYFLLKPLLIIATIYCVIDIAKGFALH